ncbi:capsular polysaccharide biosynthesis protein [Pseudodonghicola xiamenensis]|uniref:Capsular polysaccharide biosynthesis protein n=1 Tax=Pseudodonghicola xiamenensis TaxID=337702 RepID=A0A8J3MCM6_9RHOB|nr:capsular polysaccharide biosynthesis protein [Pseudodonghicola xiamenensis]GHG90428.1 capsular polysaccharide biosynthesis protein [Pseudodonghicola xiamenensis]
MTRHDGTDMAGGKRPRLFVYNGGFLTQPRLRRMLALAGYDLRLGLPRPGDAVAVWGAGPTAHRGLAIAARRSTPVLRVEDALLRSLHPGRAGEPPIGLTLDWSGPHFDPAQPSDLERLLATHPLDDSALLNRARDAIARMREIGLTKYSGYDPDIALPRAPYVLVIDQTRGDASVTASGADLARFKEMLVFAQLEHPGMPVVIKTHPETRAGYRPGHFGPEDENDRVRLLSEPVDPWALMEGAVGVYTVSSQLGFEAILAGHRPRVFGQPFYSGWGLTEDEAPLPRRTRRLTRAQIFAAAMMLYPIWYDPYRDRLCELEGAMDTLEAQVQAWREDHHGWIASGMRLWKRKPLQGFFGSEKRMIFSDDPARAPAGRRRMIWASGATEEDTAVRVEDGFLRSRGLGAKLVPPLSLVTDDLGIYYDPRRPSRLEALIGRRTALRPDQSLRAQRLIAALTAAGLSKYNLDGALPELPPGQRILVPGQVENDASILTGAGAIRTNLALLQAVRAANPQAVIIYKPHPDVEAGLRPGAVDTEGLADLVAHRADPMALLSQVDAVWTMTSLLGFEALLRGVDVTSLGAPFYAGWGLTRDLGEIPPRRTARPSLEGLVHAALIDYPRYRDPVTRLACPVEVIVERLARNQIPKPPLANRSLSKLQGIFATYAYLWR